MIPTDDEFDRRVHERHMQAVRSKLINAAKLVVAIGVVVFLVQLARGALQ